MPKKSLGFFGTWGGTPLLAPEGVSTMMGHSWYSLTFEILTNKSKLLEERILFIHAFIHKVLVQNVHGTKKLSNSRGRIDIAVRCSMHW